MNVLVDTNVVLSAALRDRLPERVVLYVATRADCRWLVTPEIVREYIDVLNRPKFNLPAAVVEHWSELIGMRTVLVAGAPTDVSFPRDPKDAPFLAAALASDADYLISGDKDLLSVRGTLATRIVTVAEFVAEYGLT